MKPSIDVICIVCQSVFCCANCRWKHENSAHDLQFDCPICRGYRFLCQQEHLTTTFMVHLAETHLPLECKRCHRMFRKMEDLTNIDKCNSISELIDKNLSTKMEELDEIFDAIYEKGVNGASKTKMAVITPNVRKVQRNLVDYECNSDTDCESSPKVNMSETPHPRLGPKTPKVKRNRNATPHVKKLMSLMRQKVVEDYEEVADDENEGSPVIETTPSRNEDDPASIDKQMTTPTSHLPHLAKLTQTVTTSTPTHAIVGNWSLFPDQGADSPLSEIETTESPAQDAANEPSKADTESIAPKLKSIIVTGSRLKLGSQDSSEKQVTFQDSAVSEASSIKKRVKFADNTVFEQPKVKRVFRKPKRMLTPGPQKPRFCYNPRFQALINRFENQVIIARTPKNTNRDSQPESTPPVGEPSNLPARAINFKEESPIVEVSTGSRESDSFKSCVGSPLETNAMQAFTTNVAGSLQNCLSSVLKTSEEETEIEFKFVITKKKVSVRRIADDSEDVNERSNELDREAGNVENIWTTVAKAVKNVFWTEKVAITPVRSNTSNTSNESSSSSASKRKCDEMEPDMSPLNHKRYKYSGRILGRPPLRRAKTLGVSALRSTRSAEQSLLQELCQEENLNLSF